MVNYYSILQVSQNASQSDIKAAFKKLAVRFHPDKHSGDPDMEDRFKEVNQAYQVLSNPYEKARYDLQWQFGQQTQSYSYQPPPSDIRRPRNKEPEINWKENWVATAYAFGFTVVVATIVMTIIFVKNYIDEQNLQTFMQQRRSVFEQAQRDYEQGQVLQAMNSLEALGVFMESEQDMQEYKTQLLESFIFQAEHNYSVEDYQNAIFYYELLESFAPRNPLQLKEHLAMAYMELGQPKKAEYYIKQLLISNYREMEMYLLLGQISRDDFKDYTVSRRYFELASEVAIKRYRSVYGDAYPLFVKGASLAAEHYHLYTGLADIYYETGSYESALKAIKWNLVMWPDSSANYVTASKSLSATNQLSEACEYYLKAVELGYDGEYSLSCP